MSLSRLLRPDPKMVQYTVQRIKQDGFVFLKIDENPTLFRTISKMTQIYFKGKNQPRYTYDLGYFENPNKQHLKILTGPQIFPSLGSKMTEFGKEMDRIVNRIYNLLNPSLFQITREVGKQSLAQEGLLDFVSYRADSSSKAELVEPHVDPGLFSLNVFSDQPGLELYSRSEQRWVPLPPGYGALFCGQAATELCGLPAVSHRVVNHGTGRLTIWYELGVPSQIPPRELIQKIDDRPVRRVSEEKLVDGKLVDGKLVDGKLVDGKLVDGKLVDGKLVEVKMSNGDKKRYTVGPKATVYDLKKELELETGLPTSKSVVLPPEVSKRIKTQEQKLKFRDMESLTGERWHFEYGRLTPWSKTQPW